jgi:hypothetical protein
MANVTTSEPRKPDATSDAELFQRPGAERNNGKPGFGLCPYCKEWRTITDGHRICRVCDGVEKHELIEEQP